jgi:hypothetical protein
MFAGAGGIIAGATIGGIFSLGSALVGASAERYKADQQLTGIKYQSDNTLTGLRESNALTYKMWDRDYQIADRLGLYHPSQIAQIGAGNSAVYSLGSRGFTRNPRTKSGSIFSTY